MATGLPLLLSRKAVSLKKAIWDTDLGALPAWKARAVRIVRITIAVARDFFRGQLSLRATSLVFTTLLSLVPLLAVAFSVLKGFGVHNELQPVLLNFLEPLGEKSVEITDKIIGFVENVKAGVIGSVGLGVLFYTVISLMAKIERAFNYTWQVSQHRSMSERFSGYLIVIIVGPVLVFSALGIMATVVGSETVAQLATIQPFGWLIGLLSKLLPYIMIVAAFTFIYVFMPNTKVRVGSAVVGALVAGIMWQSTGWLFAAFVANSPKYTAIYSAFATLIVFMIWLYLSWLILLVGASIAFYHQHPEHVSAAREPLTLSARMRERLALLIMSLIGRNYYDGGPAWNLHDLARELRVPVDGVEEILDGLEAGDLLKQTADTPATYLPARPLDEMRLKTVIDAARRAGESSRISLERISSRQNVNRVLRQLDEAAAGALEGETVRALARAAADDEDVTGRDTVVKHIGGGS